MYFTQVNGHPIRPPHGLSEVMEVINPKPEPILASVSIFRDEILSEEPLAVVEKKVNKGAKGEGGEKMKRVNRLGGLRDVLHFQNGQQLHTRGFFLFTRKPS